MVNNAAPVVILPLAHYLTFIDKHKTWDVSQTPQPSQLVHPNVPIQALSDIPIPIPIPDPIVHPQLDISLDEDNPDLIDLPLDIRERVAKSQRPGTRRQYDARVKIFKEWCVENGVSKSRPPLRKVAEFFQVLFLERGQQPHTITGYKTALSDHYSKSILNLDSVVIRTLLKSYFRDRTPSLRVAPPWDLAVVLDCLKRAPFEPISVISLKYLTLKTAFLIAMATGRRRSEIHAISFDDISFSPDDTGNIIYALPVIADFIAKNELLTRGRDITKMIYVPSLKGVLGPEAWETEASFICPVRALDAYLQRTKPFRRGRHRLFIPYSTGIKTELCSSTVSSYLVQTVNSIYKQENLYQTLIDRGISVKAHQIRSCSASWAFLRGKLGLEQLMNACFWRSLNTFTAHYLKHYWTNHDDEHYTLTPFVSAGSIINPQVGV